MPVDDTPYIDRYVEPKFGWEQHIPSLDVEDVPGGHSSILMEPNVDVLAEKIQAYLDALAGPIVEPKLRGVGGA